LKTVRNIIAIAAFILFGVLIGLALGGQGDGDGTIELSESRTTPTAIRGTVVRATVTATGTPAPTHTPVAACSPAPTCTPPPTPTPTATDTPTPTPTPTQQPPAAVRPAKVTVFQNVPEEAVWGPVVRVADGDTLTMRFEDGAEDRIRLLDVDTPETVHPNRPEECFGAQASEFTETLLGQRIGIEAMGRDRFDRVLAYVWVETDEGAVLWNLRLLEEGLAVYNDFGNPGKYADMSREAAENALLAGVGLWSACTLTFDPTPTPTSHPTPVRTGSGQDAQVGCPQGCVSQPDPSCNIKGNVNKRNDTKIYHTDGESPSYARVNMKADEGDLWFCTVEEAVANGFRAPRN